MNRTRIIYCILLVVCFCVYRVPSVTGQSCNNVDCFDDFSNISLNKWGGVKSTFAVGGARCEPKTLTGNEAFGRNGRTLSLEYDVSANGSFSGFATRLNNADLSKFRYFSLMVRGAVGGEFCRLQLADEQGNATIRSKVSLWDYLPNGPDTTWRKVFIPLDAFYTIQNRESVDELAIVFENVQSSLNESAASGTIYFDNFIFGSYDPGFIKIDHFDDRFPGNALGGNVGIFSQVANDNAYNLEFSDEIYGRHPNGLIATYDKAGQSEFGGVFFILGDGFDRVYRDLSDYHSLSFTSRAINNDVNPESFRIEIGSFDDAQEEPFTTSETIDGLTTSNQSFEFVLSEFEERFEPNRPLNTKKIGGFNILFEDNLVLADHGEIMFDDIEFRKSWYQGEDQSFPPTPINLTLNGQIIEETIVLSKVANIGFDLNEDTSKLESISFIYRKQSENEWTTYLQQYVIDCESDFTIQIDPGRLPTDEELSCRIVTENYNGQQSRSSVFKVLVDPLCPFYSCDSLFKRSFEVFQDMRNDTGIYRDATRFTPPQFHPSSVANIGMGLISLCIADAMNWIDNAEDRILLTLQAMSGEIEGFSPAKNAMGFFRHFIELDTGAQAWDSEFSTIDSAILISGALFCKKYFINNSTIAIYVDKLFTSINWDSAIANPTTGEIYLTQDSLGVGGATTSPFNEYMIVAWIALHDSSNNERAQELWNNYYRDPQDLPKSTYEGMSVLTDVPGQFLAGFVAQFPYYLCNYFTTNEEYLQFLRNAMEIDMLWWQENTEQPDYVWGFGAGASPNPPVTSAYNADNILEHPGTVCSPHIIAGYIPIEPSKIDDLKMLYQDSLGVYMLTNNTQTKLLWRFSTDFPDWRAEDVQGVDFSTMLFGLASHPDALGIDFFAKYNNFTFPPPTPTDISNRKNLAPDKFALYQNFPNPFNAGTMVEFTLPKKINLSLSIYDILGNRVRLLHSGDYLAGIHRIQWDGRDDKGQLVSSGVYFIRLQSVEYNTIIKAMMLK